MASLLTQQKQVVRDLEEAKVKVGILETNAFVANLQVRPTLLDRIKEAQQNDPNLMKILEEIERDDCFTKNDIIFANRPRLLARKHLGYDYTTIVSASSGHLWRNLRRITTIEILSTSRIQMFSSIHGHEVYSLICGFLEALVTANTTRWR
ncbi:unnamed protein product [Ilex paraguariensis]|uniref:Uncharacterized protein n=1 Tax=Ilex paraguariensis TaxID=185542 RepID=A0ABC8UG44_9AQUA